LKGIGVVFAGPSKAPHAFTLRKEGIVAAAERVGFRPQRCSINKAAFYFSGLIVFKRI